MSQFDLTNKNISDTFQHLLQKATGSEGHLYDLKGNQVTDLTIAGTLHAQSYIVSQSVVNVSSGSTVFGDSDDDTHSFFGDTTITGSMIISGGSAYGSASLTIVPTSSLAYGLLITGSTYNGIPLALIQTSGSGTEGYGEFIFGKGRDGENSFRLSQGFGGSGVFAGFGLSPVTFFVWTMDIRVGNACLSRATSASVTWVADKFSQVRFFSLANSLRPASVIWVLNKFRSVRFFSLATSLSPLSVIWVPPNHREVRFLCSTTSVSPASVILV